MRRNILLVQFVGVLLLLPSIMSGQQHSSDNKNWAEKGIVIREVEILGKRPMKDIGVQQTRFDSLVLKENIALSMADILTFNSSIFVKSYGRATLSTVSFRGTSASHTQVTWNGMRINVTKRRRGYILSKIYLIVFSTSCRRDRNVFVDKHIHR